MTTREKKFSISVSDYSLSNMVASSISLSCFSPCLSHKFNYLSHSNESPRNTAISSFNAVVAGTETASDGDDGQRHVQRRPLLLGLGTLTASVLPATSLKAEEIPAKYREFVDFTDGYSYIYPSDWKDFDFRGHDSAFKDRYLQLQNVRVRFIPTQKKDIHDLGPMEEVIYNLVKHVYAAPNQRPTIYDMQERSVDGKNYYTFEYVLTSPNYSSASFATIGIGNERYYTLIVGALERRWRRVRDKLKVVADSFKILDI
ncbi:photosynthetic NDH subunit of lumenal location 1, chloroplastic isoform X2 [Prosopis cineraria]|uniref:photosynthetic NDH subunit of lumenal location 1, chloroplastic isoform X2 n=1 Tax=Prosopis cineraria TaxID=364024 RepID=UPI00240F2E8E|nr:photosynthetic NDH subunit of lumenal location 1, chloroplastic isoform X2 [Prosopis cineraria]